MKNIKTIIIILTFTTICKSQTLNKYNPYVGTWQYQNNSEVFEVTIWEEEEKTFGHYRKYLVDDNGVFQSEILNSDKRLGNSNQNWPYVLYAGKYEIGDNILGGPIKDNTVTNAPNGMNISGQFSMKMQAPTCNGCPLNNVLWEVKRGQGVTIGDIVDYSILTYCILTKVN